MKKLLRANDVIKAVDKHTNDDGSLDDDITCILEEIEGIPEVKTNSQIVEISLEALYFDEIIKEFLERYNTVSVQKSKDCYVIKVERPA